MNKVIDYVKIALIAYVGVWLINRGLTALGLSQYTTSAATGSSGKASGTSAS